MAGIISTARLGFPFETDSPFLFAVYHLDRCVTRLARTCPLHGCQTVPRNMRQPPWCHRYPTGNAKLGVDASMLRGHRIGADFGNPQGWNMYHGSEGIPGFPKHPHRGFETITVTRRGLIDHTDSLGNGGRFGVGDVQWMTAGTGRGLPCVGLRFVLVVSLACTVEEMLF